MTPEEEKRINDRFERIETDLETIAGYVLKHERWFEEQSRLFSSSQSMLIELTGKMSELVEAGKRTDERLNIVIGMVERYFSNGEKR
jgi:hypothetical protein